MLRSGLRSRLRARLLQAWRRLGRWGGAHAGAAGEREQGSEHGPGEADGGEPDGPDEPARNWCCGYNTRHSTQPSIDFRTRHPPTLVDLSGVSAILGLVSSSVVSVFPAFASVAEQECGVLLLAKPRQRMSARARVFERVYVGVPELLGVLRSTSVPSGGSASRGSASRGSASGATVAAR